jgi:hypothetical protein
VLPVASHARFRPLRTYEALLTEQQMEIVDVIPMYYLLNRTFVPKIGPALLRIGRLREWLYALDKRWRNLGRDNGRSMKLLLARKKQ